MSAVRQENSVAPQSPVPTLRNLLEAYDRFGARPALSVETDNGVQTCSYMELAARARRWSEALTARY